MYKVFVIARREYNAAVRAKSFLISLLALPLLMGGSVFMQWLLKDHVDTTEKRFAVVDRTPGEMLYRAIAAAADVRNRIEIYDPASGKQVKPAFVIERVESGGGDRAAIDEQRFTLSQRVRRGELFGFLEIGAHVFDEASGAPPEAGTSADGRLLRYQSNSPTYDAFQRWVEPIVNDAVKLSRFRAAGLSPDKFRSALAPVPLQVKGLSQRDPASGRIEEARDENQAASMLAPAGLMILMFMLIMVGTTPLMQGVVEEKMQRIAEVLLGSVRPFELMAGKLLGLTAVSVTLAAVYLGVIYWAAHHFGYAQFVAPGVMAWFLVYLVLGVLMYGAMFIAVGAACTDLRETQTMLWPVMVVAMIPLFIWLNVAREPSSGFATVASFVPTATPMLMLIRVAVPPGIGWWQPALGVVLVLATTIVCVYAAGRIFRVGLLMQGKGASARDLARWVLQG